MFCSWRKGLVLDFVGFFFGGGISVFLYVFSIDFKVHGSWVSIITYGFPRTAAKYPATVPLGFASKKS